MRIDRNEFIEELILREYISKKIKKIISEEASQEEELRAMIRSIIVEAEDAELSLIHI